MRIRRGGGCWVGSAILGPGGKMAQHVYGVGAPLCPVSFRLFDLKHPVGAVAVDTGMLIVDYGGVVLEYSYLATEEGRTLGDNSLVGASGIVHGTGYVVYVLVPVQGLVVAVDYTPGQALRIIWQTRIQTSNGPYGGLCYSGGWLYACGGKGVYRIDPDGMSAPLTSMNREVAFPQIRQLLALGGSLYAISAGDDGIVEIKLDVGHRCIVERHSFGSCKEVVSGIATADSLVLCVGGASLVEFYPGRRIATVIPFSLGGKADGAFLGRIVVPPGKRLEDGIVFLAGKSWVGVLEGLCSRQAPPRFRFVYEDLHGVPTRPTFVVRSGRRVYVGNGAGLIHSVGDGEYMV